MASQTAHTTMNILVMGASGSGTTTLGAALASALGGQHLDADDYFWLPTHPPYTQRRPPDERRQRVMNAIASAPIAIVSGCVRGWGPEVESVFDLVVFLSVDTNVRVARLRERERRNLGYVDEEFIAWAAQYEEGRLEGRSRARQETWLSTTSSPVLRVEGERAVETLVALVMEKLNTLSQRT